MDTIFTKIIRREIPSPIIYEDEHTIVIPDKFPSMPGQLLVISKRPVEYIFDLSDEEYFALLTTTKKVALALDQVSGLDRTCLVTEGFEVPHVHIRVYPCNAPGLVLHPRTEASEADLKDIAEKVKAALS